MEKESYVNISDKYDIDYRIIKTWFNDIMSGPTGYAIFAPVYIDKQTKKVCWFETEKSNNDEYYRIVEKEFRVDFNNQNENEQQEYIINLVNALQVANSLPIIEANDYLKGGKYHELALQWFKDNNYKDFPENIY